MTARRPLVNIAGTLQELPAADAVAGALPLWWIAAGETVVIPERGQYVIHGGEFRNEGELRLGANAELRVTA